MDMQSAGTKNIIYLFTLAGFLLIFKSLDWMGFHYQPEEHRLNQTKHVETEVAANPEVADVHQEAIKTEVPHSQEKPTASEEEMEDPYFTDNMKRIYVALVFLLSTFFAVRTFRNKPSA